MKKTFFRSFCRITLLGLLIFLWLFLINDTPRQSAFRSNESEIAPASPPRTLTFSTNPVMLFEQNQGQAGEQVAFLARGRGYSLYLKANGAALALYPQQQEKKSDRKNTGSVEMRFIGAKPQPEIEGLDASNYRANYFIGDDPAKWRRNVPSYQKVRYREIYPGIDMIYYGCDGELEFDFVLSPGADPKQIAMRFDGADALELDANGHLLLRVGNENIVVKAPAVHQENDGEKVAVAGHYVIIHENEVRFQIDEYEPSLALVIDPVLVYSTYLGGTRDEAGLDINVDSQGNFYVMGATRSVDFPTVLPMQRDQPNVDVFVSKFDPSGALTFSTYLGGNDFESFLGGIAVDAAGNIYVSGSTLSTNFPTKNAFQPQIALPPSNISQRSDAFITKIAASGADLVFSTYLGGVQSEFVEGFVIDNEGNAYLTGITLSTDYPTRNPIQAANAGVYDLFIAKFSAAGSLIYSTYFGGSGNESGGGIAVDANRNMLIVGGTLSNDFPTANAVDNTFAGGDAVVLKLNATGNALVYSTYIGGSRGEGATAVAVDANGNVYVTGITGSQDFPVTTGVFQGALNGLNSDAFITKLSPAGVINYSTYLGGSLGEQADDIVVDANGNAFVIGSTPSTNFPVEQAIQPNFGGARDVFISQINSIGTALLFSSYLGGRGDEPTQLGRVALTIDGKGNIYATGETGSNNFPISDKPYQGSYAGGGDAFVVKIGAGAAAPEIKLTPKKIQFVSVPRGENRTVEVEIASTGGGTLEVQNLTIEPTGIFSLQNVPSLPFNLAPGASAKFGVRYMRPQTNAAKAAPSALNGPTGAVTIVSNASNAITAIPIEVLNYRIQAGPGRNEIRLGGDLTAIKVSILDEETGQVAADFSGSTNYKIDASKSTPGIGWRLSSTLATVENGVARDVFFETTREMFSNQTVIDALTVLSGKAFIAVGLENLNVEPAVVEVQVKSPFDFVVNGIEIQQGIVDWNKPVTIEIQPGETMDLPALDLIAEHKTVVKVAVGYRNTISLPFKSIAGLDGVTADLTMMRNGAPMISKSGRSWLLQDLNGDGTVANDDYRLEQQKLLHDAIYFTFDANEIAEPAQYNFKAVLRLNEEFLQEIASEKNNNTLITEPVDFFDTKRLKILTGVAKLREEESVPIVEAGIWSFMREAYPIRSSRLVFNDPNSRAYEFDELLVLRSTRLFSRAHQILNRYNEENPSGQRDKLVLFTTAKLAENLCKTERGGCAVSLSGNVAVVHPNTSVGSSVLAHELAHCLGLGDTYIPPGALSSNNPRRSDATNEGNFAEDGNINLVNSQKAINTIDPSTNSRFNPFFEFMGKRNAWVDRVTWNYLYQNKLHRNLPSNLLQSTADRFIAVSGIVDTNGVAILNPLIEIPDMPEFSNSQKGRYWLNFMDEAGLLLSEFNFDLNFNVPGVGKEEGAAFSFNLTLPNGAAQISLLKDQVALVSRKFSKNPPVIRINSPSSGEKLGETTTIAWTASDPDGDALAFDILYSPDGQEQIVVDVNLTATSYELRSAFVPKSSAATLTVIATDGINEGRATLRNLVVSVEQQEQPRKPTNFALQQNYPNPFNPATTIRFNLPKASRVEIAIYDLHGQQIKSLLSQAMQHGEHVVAWDGRNDAGELVTSGVYFYRLQAGDPSASGPSTGSGRSFVQSRKMVFVR